MIKVEFTIKYYESYIPYRCRKPRYNEITESVFANLREVTMADVKLAFGIDFVDKVKRIYDKNLVDNTNLRAAFDLIKNIALQPGVNLDDVPNTLQYEYIFSH